MYETAAKQDSGPDETTHHTCTGVIIVTDAGIPAADAQALLDEFLRMEGLKL